MATESISADWSALPGDLPVPTDDGAADHLHASATSQVELPRSVLLQATTSSGEGQWNVNGQGNGETEVDLRVLSFERPVLVFVYPRTGQPGVANPPGWDAIPGARGCTPVSEAEVFGLEFRSGSVSTSWIAPSLSSSMNERG